MAQRALSHTWGPPLPGATAEADMFAALQSVQASELALERSLSLQAAPPAPAAGQFTSTHGLHSQHHHQQQKGVNNPSLDGASCRLINFTSSPSEEPENFPITFPFEVQAPHRAAAPVFFGAHPDNRLGGFVVDSSADVSGCIGGRSQDSSTGKPSSGFSANSSDWETAGRINFPFDLGADSSEEWRCSIPWESFLSPAAVQAELPR